MRTLQLKAACDLHTQCCAAAAVALAAGRKGTKSAPFQPELGRGKRCEYEREQVVRQLQEVRAPKMRDVHGRSGLGLRDQRR